MDNLHPEIICLISNYMEFEDVIKLMGTNYLIFSTIYQNRKIFPEDIKKDFIIFSVVKDYSNILKYLCRSIKYLERI